jgi:predicted nicotinamide N-methyase
MRSGVVAVKIRRHRLGYRGSAFAMDLDREQLSGMSVKELRACIAEAGLSFADCLEKSDLRERAWEAMRQSSGGTGPDAAAAEAEPEPSSHSAIDEVAARLGVDPLLLPRRTIVVGPHILTIEQNWLADTTPDNTGSACWPGSLLLAHYLISPAAAPVLGAADSGSWLELGCGAAALPGTCLLRACPAARSRLTFADRAENLLAGAAANVARNAESVAASRFVTIEWGDDLPEALPGGEYSLVICAELLYEQSAVAPLLKTLDALLAADGVAVFGHRARNGAHEECLRAAATHGLEWVELSWRPWSDDSCELTQTEAEAWGCPLSILHLGLLRRRAT